MRYYVIINGVNSLTIEGLAIRTLPPISKPAMRNLREEIDGRDGDITTELGYGAYDKTLEIGLYGAYDINKIIAFFNSKGKIIFSDEPDKYYNFEIVDKIDYTKLVKFRTATINIHCQPFKYPVSEEPQEEEYEYVEATGTNVTLDNTSEAIFNKIDLLGNTEQTQYTGKNKFDTTQITTTGIVEKLDTGFKITCGLNSGGRTGPAWTNPLDAGSYKLISNLTKSSSSADLRMQVNYTNSTVSYYSISNNVVNFGNVEKAIASIQFYFQNGTPNDEWAKLENLMIIKSTDSETPYEPYVGGIPSPSPNYPQDIHVVSGNNTIEITGRQLLDLQDGQAVVNGVTAVCKDGEITLNGTATANAFLTIYVGSQIKWVEGETYTITGFNPIANSNVRIRTNTNGTNDSILSGVNQSKTFTNEASLELYTERIQIRVQSGTTLTNYKLKPMLVKGSTPPTEWEAFTSQSLPLNLGDLEMASIPNTDYKDTFVKEGETWYKREAVGKFYSNTQTDWSNDGNNRYNSRIQSNIVVPPNNDTKGTGVCNVGIVTANQTLPNSSGIAGLAIHPVKRFYISAIVYTNIPTTPITLYYAHETPTDIEVNETLADQLEAIKNAISYDGQTNISQTNNDLPFILDLSALELGSDHLVINNAGNIYAKPTIDIEGTGVVDIYLNDVQILEADLSETNNIVIDTEAMEAYNPDTNALANRQVTGDYSKIKLEPGDNDLRFSGDLSKATITDYTRWL